MMNELTPEQTAFEEREIFCCFLIILMRKSDNGAITNLPIVVAYRLSNI